VRESSADLPQCNEEDGTCDEMAREILFKDRVASQDAAKYKCSSGLHMTAYNCNGTLTLCVDMLDVDGNGWSSRFHRLLISGSMVIKSTIYPEWHSDWLTPWVHYVVGRLGSRPACD